MSDALKDLIGTVTEQEMVYTCVACSDSGFVVTRTVDGVFSRRCACRIPSTEDRMVKLGVPRRNAECTIDTLDVTQRDRSVSHAVMAARAFVREYPVGTAGRGLLLVGPCGTGKTHLSVGILRELVTVAGASGRFYDFRELFARLKRTYASDAQEDERTVLDELFAADVLVLDELGAARRTDWSYDVAEGVIDGLYRRRGTTIITTNLANMPPASGSREETLGDRIGMRAFSRLQEMCRVLPMDGADFRMRRAG